MPPLYYWQAVVLGFSAAAMPGPFQAYLVETATRRGRRAAAMAAFAPLLSDGPIILIATLLLAHLPAWSLPVLRIVGGAYVLYLALVAYLTLRDQLPKFDDDPPPATPPVASVRQAATINLLSPGVYIYWATVSGPLLIEGWRAHPLTGIAFLALFYGTMILASQVLVLAATWLAAASRLLMRILQAGSALLMWLFAEAYLWQGLTELFR